jgi:hypothetical protein
VFADLEFPAIMIEHNKSLPEVIDDKVEEAYTTAVENVASETKSAPARTRDGGDELTLRKVLRHHPALVWWSFYWAMAGVAW